MKTAVVIPLGPGRLNNVMAVLDSLAVGVVKPDLIVIVADGPKARIHMDLSKSFRSPTVVMDTPKAHRPGLPQPRNLGARVAADLSKQDERFAGITHVWFLDSDIIVGPHTLEAYHEAMRLNSTPRILVGPYDWLPAGKRTMDLKLRNDPDGVPPPGRWGTFDRFGPEHMFVGDLSAGLGCLSGNLMWPLDLFIKTGGFWDELHHGRCEDGELGLRAVVMGIPISFVRDARAWHLYHERNVEEAMRRNAIDVPKINERYPYEALPDGHGDELLVVDEDGKRFNFRCGLCDEEMNTLFIWGHQADHAYGESREL